MTKLGHRAGLDLPDLVARQFEVLGEFLERAVKEGLLALAVGAGLQVLHVLMEEDVTSLAGPKGRHDRDRVAKRHGTEDGSVTLGGRRVPVRRPRVRSADGRREIPVAAYETFASTEVLGERALERMMAKLSTRRYQAGLEPVGQAVAATATSTSRSAVSRRFVALTERALAEMMADDLSDQRRTKYHPTDASRFEEGYVGITRAVEETRIYIVDGHRDHHDEDLVHTPAEILDTGITTIIDALSRRGAQEMAHELDPAASLFGIGPVTRTLCDLRLKREELDAALGRAPAAVDVPLAGAVRRRDELRARRQVWAEKLHRLEKAGTAILAKDAPSLGPPKARGELAAVERAIARAERTMAGLQRRAAARREFLAGHRFELEQRDRLRRLEHARELQVRLRATDTAPPALLARLGPRPLDERRRQPWSRAVEGSAVLCERYDSDAAAALAGAKPSHPGLRELRRTINAVVPEPGVPSVEII